MTRQRHGWIIGVTLATTLTCAQAFAQEVGPPDEVIPQSYSPEESVSPDAFNDALSPYGEWLYVGTYGRVWRPRVAMVGLDFRPYFTGGHWVYTSYGWTFVSDYPWGWAPFHYGRWVLDVDFGWFWVPGTVWSPAWVDWRYGGGYVGWVPLAPYGARVVIGSYYRAWCFVPTSHFLAPNFHHYALPVDHFHRAFSATARIHEQVNYSGVHWSAGPPPGQVSHEAGRPIQAVAVAPPAPGTVQPVHIGGAPAGVARGASAVPAAPSGFAHPITPAAPPTGVAQPGGTPSWGHSPATPFGGSPAPAAPSASGFAPPGGAPSWVHPGGTPSGGTLPRAPSGAVAAPPPSLGHPAATPPGGSGAPAGKPRSSVTPAPSDALGNAAAPSWVHPGAFTGTPRGSAAASGGSGYSSWGPATGTTPVAGSPAPTGFGAPGVRLHNGWAASTPSSGQPSMPPPRYSGSGFTAAPQFRSMPSPPSTGHSTPYARMPVPSAGQSYAPRSAPVVPHWGTPSGHFAPMAPPSRYSFSPPRGSSNPAPYRPLPAARPATMSPPSGHSFAPHGGGFTPAPSRPLPAARPAPVAPSHGSGFVPRGIRTH